MKDSTDASQFTNGTAYAGDLNSHSALTEEQKDFFLTHGYIHLKNCFNANAVRWQENLQGIWPRLGMSANEKTTWARPYVLLPPTAMYSLEHFSPKAFSAVCELLGGPEHVAQPVGIPDDYIMNLGSSELATAWATANTIFHQDSSLSTENQGQDRPTREHMLDPLSDPYPCKKWHADGPDFVHYLDSPEQALIIIIFWTDVTEGQGPTILAEYSIEKLARHLVEHPEGVLPTMWSTDSPVPDDLSPFFDYVAGTCSRFTSATGKAGDIYLVHPLMVHSFSPNFLRIPRVITNPKVMRTAPFRYYTKDNEVWSLVEQVTLRALGSRRERLQRSPPVEPRLSVQEAWAKSGRLWIVSDSDAALRRAQSKLYSEIKFNTDPLGADYQ